MKKILLIFLALAFLLFISSCSKEDEAFSDGISNTADGAFTGEAGSSEPAGSGNGTNPEPGQMTAGEWNDLDNWDFWTNLLANENYEEMPAHWEVGTNHRVAVHITNGIGGNLVNVPVELVNGAGDVLWTTRTDNLGRAELFAELFSLGGSPDFASFSIRANNQMSVSMGSVKPINQGVNEIILTGVPTPPKAIEVAFVVDATGSMGDELSYLKSELMDVVNTVKTNNPVSSIKLGSVFYRDQGDEYLTRRSDFSSDFSVTNDFINNQEPGGGGDFPEAVETAVNVALNDLQWTDAATTKIMFLILDAPPHHEPQIIDNLQESMAYASAKGIKIIPITASGINKETEFLMRFMAISTNGTYVFITDHSGIGNPHLEASVGEYQVEFLNDLMSRLINKYAE